MDFRKMDVMSLHPEATLKKQSAAAIIWLILLS